MFKSNSFTLIQYVFLFKNNSILPMEDRPLLLSVPLAVTCEWNDKEERTDTYILLSHEELMTVASPGKSKQDDSA